MATPLPPPPDAAAKGRRMAAPVRWALSGVTAQSAALTAGYWYDVWADADWYMSEQAANPTAAVATSAYLKAGQVVEVWVSGTSDTKIAGITSGAAGNAFAWARS